MWSKKWYLRRNISCDAHLLNELLETDVPWDDAIVVSAGKLRKLWDSLSELRSSLCKRLLERKFLRPGLLPVKTAYFTHFFPSGMTSHSKIAQFNWEFIERLILTEWWSCFEFRALFSAMVYLHFVHLVAAKQLRDKITCQIRRHVTVFILEMIIDSKYLWRSDVTSKNVIWSGQNTFIFDHLNTLRFCILHTFKRKSERSNTSRNITMREPCANIISG